MGIILKTRDELDRMWAANQVVCSVLDVLGKMIEPGLTTGQIGQRAFELVQDFGVEPAFLGYGDPPFPAVTCISVNDEVVHGIPRYDRILTEGDLVSVDFGVAKDGYYGDSARTFGVGQLTLEAQRLINTTEAALGRAIEQCQVGNRLADISAAIQSHVESNGFSVVRAFYGHGIGTSMHEDPLVPNFVERTRRSPELKTGMVIAIEPMVNLGGPGITIDNDGWTARTRDGKLSAHFEHSVAILPEGPWVLSERDSQAPDLVDSVAVG